MKRNREGWSGPLISFSDAEESGDPSQVRLGSAEFPGWMVTVRFGPMGEVVGFRVDENGQAGEREPLTSALLHRMRPGEAIARARVIAAATARARSRRGDDRFGPARGDGPDVELAQFQALVHERPGVGGKPDLVFARAAAEYVRLVESGDRAPLRGLANLLYVSESRARNIVHEARQRGLLTTTTQGKRGGQLTARARRLLSEGGNP